MEASASTRPLTRTIPRPVLDALLAFVRPLRVLEVPSGGSGAGAACLKAGIAYDAVREISRFQCALTPEEDEPDLVLITAMEPDGTTWMSAFDVQEPISSAWAATAPDGIVAVWVPPNRRSAGLLSIVLGALPRQRLEAVWAFAARREHTPGVRARPGVPCAYLVLFRAQPDLDVEYVA